LNINSDSGKTFLQFPDVLETTAFHVKAKVFSIYS